MTQEEVLTILKTGTNVFLTGEPGSGKTHTVNRYIAYLREHKIGVAVTASTGIAATHLGGMTIHSWSGIGIKKTLSETDIAKLQTTRRLTSRAQKTNVLVIDEISMLDSQTLLNIDTALRALCEKDEPFGGMQVVFVGDFFQLPPVVREGEIFSGFAFESPAWSEANPVICYLTEQHRHEDPGFVSLLSAIRRGGDTTPIYNSFSLRKTKMEFTQVHTRLYSHNADVDRENEQKLRSLPGKEVEYQMTSRGNKKLVDQLKKGCLSPEILVLKKGARVMFTKNNFEEGFVNGTLGEVVGFGDEGLPIVVTKTGLRIEVFPMEWIIEDVGRTVASITQIPLRLAWAITVHKSQGMTLDAAVVDLSRAFERGQGYVALSRVRTLAGLFLRGLNQMALKVHPKILEIDADFRQKSVKAQNALGRYLEEQLLAKHRHFILKSGGSLKKVNSEVGMSTYDITFSLYKDGKTVLEIAEARGLKEGTIITHLEKLKARGSLTKQDLQRVITGKLANELPKIHKAFEESEDEKLSPVFHKLRGRYSYNQLRLARLVS